MSTYTSEPGTRLAGRYRLVDQVSEGAGWTYWKATDETLARSVTVLTFATGFPRVTETVTAARAASRVGDPRFSQVFDVEDAGDLAYVVLEWVVGESLLDMLSEGLLDPPRAAALIAEAARAIAAAHEVGLAHLRLDPACLHWTPGGGVKIAGLCIDAALAGPAADDGDGGPELIDTRDLARLLYAALTGYWPGHLASAGSAPGLLPLAPENDGIPCTPRQVSADVPTGIDDVTCRALFQRPNRHGPALSTAAMFADALLEAAPPLPVSPAALGGRTAATQGYGYQPDGTADSYSPPDPAATTPRAWAGGRKPPPQRSAGARAIVSAVVVLVLVVVGATAWAVSRSLHRSAVPTPPRSNSSSAASAAAAALVKPVSASVYNPLGSPGDDDPADAGNAIAGSASTPWHTSYYFSPVFGNLKKGTGLIVDLGRQVRLSQVMVQFGAQCCTHVDIEIGNSSTSSVAALNNFTVVQRSAHAANSTTFDVTKPTTGRYLLIWITDLPPMAGNPGRFETLVYHVTVHGFAAGQPG
jgi:hypothetical protein